MRREHAVVKHEVDPQPWRERGQLFEQLQRLEHERARASNLYGSCVTRSPDTQYMLDTDTVSYALRGQGRVAAELRFGAEARRSRKLHRLNGTFVEAVAVVPFDRPAANRFAVVAASLARRGEPIGTFDTFMAAHALSLGLTFVTKTTKHFSRRGSGQKTESDPPAAVGKLKGAT